MAARPPTAGETAAGIARLEGYLLCQAELRTARTEAEAFARHMPWLTIAQHEEVTRHYARERVALSKEVLRAVTARCTELEEQYAARYHALRQRLLCLSVAILIGSATLLTAAGLTLAYGGD
jgi:hypothetical protein